MEISTKLAIEYFKHHYHMFFTPLFHGGPSDIIKYLSDTSISIIITKHEPDSSLLDHLNVMDIMLMVW